MPSARRDLHLLTDTSFLLTVLGTLGGTVVTSGEDPLILDEDGSDPSPEACGPLGDQLSHLHEIFVIIRTFHVWVIAF